MCTAVSISYCRFVGYELYSVNQTFKDTVEAMVRVMAPNATFTATYRPGVEATIYGPDGLNGTGSAFAPTPGTGLASSRPYFFSCSTS